LASAGMSVLGQCWNVSTWPVRMPALVKRYHPRYMTVLVPSLYFSTWPVRMSVLVKRHHPRYMTVLVPTLAAISSQCSVAPVVDFRLGVCSGNPYGNLYALHLSVALISSRVYSHDSVWQQGLPREVFT